MKFHNTCRVPMYHSQISTRLCELQRERERVVEHLELLDHHISTLEETLTIMQSQDDSVLALNSEVYNKHKVRHSVFTVRPRKVLLYFLKENATQRYTTRELAQMLLDREQNDIAISERILDSVRQSLLRLYKQDIIHKYREDGKFTVWQWGGSSAAV